MENLKLPAILLLIMAYIIYSGFVYTVGTENKNSVSVSEEVKQGKMLWQKKNCTACHQLYGLGGYMGPDLTNVISTKRKGEPYATAILKYGMGAMPKFDFNENEVKALVEYLKYVDATGKSPIKDFELTYYGMVEKRSQKLEIRN